MCQIIECKKMGGKNYMKFTDAQQAKVIDNFKNAKGEILLDERSYMASV